MSEMVSLPKEAARRVFDALVNSMNFGSGFLETDDVKALRVLAEAIGVDPLDGTPREFMPDFPHPFEPAPVGGVAGFLAKYPDGCKWCQPRRRALPDDPIHAQCEATFGGTRCDRVVHETGAHRHAAVPGKFGSVRWGNSVSD